MSAFEELGVCPELIRAADDAGWLLPTPVQAEAVPLILGGGDVLAAAETGSGKTGAFGIPVLQIVHEALRDAAAARATGGPSAAMTDETADGAASVRVSVDDRSALFAVNNSPPDLPKGLALTQARSPAQWAGARATVGVAHGGRHHFEITVRDDGLVRCGWSTVATTGATRTNAVKTRGAGHAATEPRQLHALRRCASQGGGWRQGCGAAYRR